MVVYRLTMDIKCFWAGTLLMGYMDVLKLRHITAEENAKYYMKRSIQDTICKNGKYGSNIFMLLADVIILQPT